MSFKRNHEFVNLRVPPTNKPRSTNGSARSLILSVRMSASSDRRRGTILVMIALMLPVIVGMAAFAVDLGIMTLLRLQIQNAVDAGALAASLKLRQDPMAVDEASVLARQFVRLNRVGMGIMVPEESINVEIGRWDDATKTFTATSVEPNAVRVFARQENEPHFFGQIFGQTTFGAPASAVASGADIMMVLDLSGSMKHEGRIEALRNAAPVFVDVIESIGGDDQIGMMGLSANPATYNPASKGHSGVKYNSGSNPSNEHHVGVLEQMLTTNFSSLRSNTLSSSELVAGKYTGWTGTGAALRDAAHYLSNGAESRSSSRNVIVLMGDGNANRPSEAGPDYARAMATYAASLNVTVYTISLGNGADIALMQEIAQLTSGEHFDATGSGEAALTALLTKAFEQVAAEIKRTQLVQ